MTVRSHSAPRGGGFDIGGDPRTPTARREAVRVQHTPRGPWEVVPPGGRGRTMCETLDDARRVAFQIVTRARPCELVVLDAYNRVLEHELIDSGGRTS